MGKEEDNYKVPKLEAVHKELRGATVGSTGSALGYRKFFLLKRETPCTVIWEKFGFKVSKFVGIYMTLSFQKAIGKPREKTSVKFSFP